MLCFIHVLMSDQLVDQEAQWLSILLTTKVRKIVCKSQYILKRVVLEAHSELAIVEVHTVIDDDVLDLLKLSADNIKWQLKLLDKQCCFLGVADFEELLAYQKHFVGKGVVFADQ